MGAALALPVSAAQHSAASANALSSRAESSLENRFRTPPSAAKPHTWWHWLNGNVTRQGITADLEAMKRVGIGGAQIFNVDQGIPKGPVPFMSPDWLDMIGFAGREANRLGIELCIHNCAGWSSSGGPWITPEYAMQVLVTSETTVQGPGRVRDPLPKPPMRHDYYRDVAVLAFPTPADLTRLSNIEGKSAVTRADRLLPDTSATPDGAAIPRDGVLDLTDKMDADGRLDWDAPAGEWTILRIGHTPTGAQNAPAMPEGRGLECDKLSREAMDAHWNGMMAAVVKAMGPLAGKTLNNALIDSYEVGSQNWTPKFREEFRRRRGYDLLPYLPVVTGRIVGSREISERFLWDFRRTIADLFAENYFGYFGELCRKHGMKFSTEPYGNANFDNLQSGGTADIPMGEFWVGGGTLETLKLASSIGHTYGRPIVGAESFTADDHRGRWLIDPYSVKALGDLAFTLGVNRYIYHRYAHQPWLNLAPGMTMGPWGTHFERTETWWDPGAAWLKYVARCQSLLQSGRFAADVLYFTGESAPNDLPGRAGLRPAMPDGYDYDGCDTKILQQATVKDGRIVLPDGMDYRVLALPENEFMTPEMAGKIRDLIRDGATVVGPKPGKSPSLADYPNCDAEVSRIAGEVWANETGPSGEHRFGKGRVFWGHSLQDVLNRQGVKPDFEYSAAASGNSHSSPAGTRLAYIHRKAGGADLYFVSNQRYRADTVDCAFRVSGRLPELWHPDTGVMEPAPLYREQNGRTIVTLPFDPAGSIFVVFRKSIPTDHWMAVKHSGGASQPAERRRLTVRGAWYEPADGRPGADVTAKVKALVQQGETAIPATNELFGDPAYNVVKRLRVEYTLNGKPMTKTVGENETLELDDTRPVIPFPAYEIASGGTRLLPWDAGTYEFRSSRGRTQKVTVREGAASLRLDGPWSLAFPPHLGAPAHVTLNRLLSWSEHSDPGVRYFSGTAAYRKTFNVPVGFAASGQRVALDLGQVKNLAEVTLNGKRLGVLWKAPFRADVTGALKPGQNRLEVKVTNLWPNRLIGDEHFPEDAEWHGATLARWPDWIVNGAPRPRTGRVAFATWKFFTKDTPLLESGLLGPVTVRSVRPVPLR